MNKKSIYGTKIIGLSGKIGSGKDTFAEEFAKLCQTPCQRHAFADKLRETTELLTGYKMGMTHKAGDPFYNAVYNYTQEDKNAYLPLWNKNVGECLQVLGTDALRAGFDENVWVKALFSTAGKETLDLGHLLIIPDVRFKNEADTILDNGGMVIRLEGDPMDVRKNSKRNLNHISETDLDDYENFSLLLESITMNKLREDIKNILKNM